ncbi:thiamine-phosphate kinase [Demequina pelophila]|uniref:thiamine-phosphate kinase n=1 Tax=Demequina pelophila TaxID=1638984 RepID=UPI0009E3963F|nr:thiamine-phosphate kinase [Demequina pelophila]
MMTIGDMGEDALIAAFAPRLPTTDAEILGPGDDAAVVAVDGDLVVSSDVLLEDHHFRLDWSSPEDVGWRAAMQNLADIDAMGAVPTALQITLAAPPALEADWVLRFADGLREACEPHGVGVVGGDLSASRQISISVTVLGETHGMEPVTRADALPGQVVAVSGPLGSAAAGLAQLSAGKLVDEETVGLFLRPRPRIGAGLEAALHGATALMDVSDGLVRDAGRLARASEVGIEIDAVSVPRLPALDGVAAALDGDATAWALTGGEDHHMLAVLPSEGAVPAGWTVVGRTTDAFAGVRVDGEVPTAQGWDHFGG